MIRVELGESKGAVWQTPDGTEARAVLYAGVLGAESVQLVSLRLGTKQECSPKEMARLFAIYLDNVADSAQALARELREGRYK